MQGNVAFAGHFLGFFILFSIMKPPVGSQSTVAGEAGCEPVISPTRASLSEVLRSESYHAPKGATSPTRWMAWP
jgi:hypothetical protein